MGNQSIIVEITAKRLHDCFATTRICTLDMAILVNVEPRLLFLGANNPSTTVASVSEKAM